MKILFSTHPYLWKNPGGGERVLLNIKKNLEKKFPCEITVGSSQDYSTKYDIIHEFSLLQWQDWQKAQVNLFLTPTCWPREDFISVFKFKLSQKIKSSLGKFTITQALKLPKHIFPSTESEKQRILNYYSCDEKKLTPIPNGTDIFVTPPRDISLPFSLPSSYVLYVGRITKVKNIKLLISACNEKNLNLVIAGSPNPDELDYFDDCKRISGKNIFFIGRIEPDSDILKQLYLRSSIVCIPSEFETFSLVGIEALSLGKKLIITSQGGTKDVYQNFAEYFDPKKPQELKNILIKNLEHPQKTNDLKNYVQSKYGWDAIVNTIWSKYQDV